MSTQDDNRTRQERVRALTRQIDDVLERQRRELQLRIQIFIRQRTWRMGGGARRNPTE